MVKLQHTSDSVLDGVAESPISTDGIQSAAWKQMTFPV